MSKPKYDFAETWDELKQILTSEGAAAVSKQIGKEPNPERRNAWLGFFSQAVTFREWPGKNIDVVLAAGEEAIRDALQQADGADNDRDDWIDRANMHCYNVSANLADCWQDSMIRKEEHFLKGLELANRAIAFREQLNKSPELKAMAYWVKGKHLLSLRRYQEAQKAFCSAFGFDKRALDFKDLVVENITDDMSFGIIVNAGFVGLARFKGGDVSGKAVYERALTVFKNWLDDAARKGDAEIGIMELKESMKLN